MFVNDLIGTGNNAPSIGCERGGVDKNERERRLKSLQEARKRARVQREELKNKPYSSLFAITDADEQEARELQHYLVRSNLTKAERERRLSSDEVALAIATWGLDELQQLWAMREQKLGYVEDSALLLASIRYKAGIDPAPRPLAEVLRLDSVHALVGVLEDRGLDTAGDTRAGPCLTSGEASVVPAMAAKRVETVLRVIREGQANFRRQLIDYYGPVCMATGTCVAAVIDAAHIIPYGGRATNALGNGLLLRKDVHALFDAGLIRVTLSLTFHVSPELTDECYAELHGQRLKFTVPPRISVDCLKDRLVEDQNGGDWPDARP